MKKPKSQQSQDQVSRRTFLKSTSTAVIAGAVFYDLQSENVIAGISNGTRSEMLENWQSVQEANLRNQRLLTGWEYRQGSLGGAWEAWRKANDDANIWRTVEMPHCFNAYDAVDPDVPYYQGPGWYRIRIKIENPYSQGRTLLHFEGAGKKSEVYVYTT